MRYVEIRRPIPKDTRTKGGDCPNCGRTLYFQMIGCPEDRPGCLVIHYGWHCDNCGKDFNEVS